MAYSKTLLRKGVKRKDPRMCRKGASNKAVKSQGPGSLTQCVKWLRDN